MLVECIANATFQLVTSALESIISNLDNYCTSELIYSLFLICLTSWNPLASRIEHLFGRLSKMQGRQHSPQLAIQLLGWHFFFLPKVSTCQWENTKRGSMSHSLLGANKMLCIYNPKYHLKKHFFYFKKITHGGQSISTSCKASAFQALA